MRKADKATNRRLCKNKPLATYEIIRAGQTKGTYHAPFWAAVKLEMKVLVPETT